MWSEQMGMIGTWVCESVQEIDGIVCGPEHRWDVDSKRV